MTNLITELQKADSLQIDNNFIRYFNLEEDFNGNTMLEISFYDSEGYSIEFQFTYKQLEKAIFKNNMWVVYNEIEAFYIELYKLEMLTPWPTN